MNRRGLFGLAAAAVAGITAMRPARAADGAQHRLALHVDQNNEDVMKLALNNARNAYDYYHDKGESIEVELVAYSEGLHMLRADSSPVKDRIAELHASVPTIKFSACGNTKRGMEKREGKPVTLLPQATVVPAGIVRLVELEEAGWSYVRP